MPKLNSLHVFWNLKYLFLYLQRPHHHQSDQIGLLLKCLFLQKKAKYLGNFWANLMKDTFEIKTDVATLWATLLKIWHFFFHQVSLIIASSSQIFCLEVRCNWVQLKFCSLLIFFTLTQWEQIGRFLRCFGVKLVAEMYDDFLA